MFIQQVITHDKLTAITAENAKEEAYLSGRFGFPKNVHQEHSVHIDGVPSTQITKECR